MMGGTKREESFDREVLTQARLRAAELRAMGFLRAASELDEMAHALQFGGGDMESQNIEFHDFECDFEPGARAATSGARVHAA